MTEEEIQREIERAKAREITRITIDYTHDVPSLPVRTDCVECYLNIYSQIGIDLLVAITGLVIMNICWIYAYLDPHMMCAVWSLGLAMTMTQNTKVANSACCAVLIPYLILEHQWFHLITAVVIVFISYAANDITMSVGGKSGAIGYFAALFTFLIYYLISFSGVYEFKELYLVYNKDFYNYLNWYVFVFAPLVTVLAAVSVVFIAWYIDGVMIHGTKYMSYGQVLFIGAVFFEMADLTYFTVDSKPLTWGHYLVDYWHVGCFVGMTSKFKFKKYVKNYNIHNYIIIAYMAGWINIAFYGLLNLGGRQGLISFFASYIWILLLDWFNCCCQFNMTWYEDARIAIKTIEPDRAEERIELSIVNRETTHEDKKHNVVVQEEEDDGEPKPTDKELIPSDEIRMHKNGVAKK